MDYVDDELEAGRPKVIDIEYLLSEVIPQLLSLSGEYRNLGLILSSMWQLSDGHHRMSFLTGKKLRICEPIFEIITFTARRAIYVGCNRCTGG